MPPPKSTYSRNLLIQSMTPDDLALLKPLFERVDLAHHQILAGAHEPISHVYFPESGVVSLTGSTAGDGRTELGVIGREGLTGTAVLLGTDRSPNECFVQVDGASALRIGADDLRQSITQSGSLQTLLLRYIQTFFIQSAYNTISNARDGVEARLARWLLMCHDRIDGDEIHLTHEFMSRMISARRSGVTVSLHILEGAGIIWSERARLIILDREKLQNLAGETYGVPEAEYRRLIGPFGKSPD